MKKTTMDKIKKRPVLFAFAIILILTFSFLATWPITVFVNYIMSTAGIDFAFKVWQFWTLWFLINIIFKPGEKK